MSLSEFDILKRVKPNLFEVGLVYPDEENEGKFTLWTSHHAWNIKELKDFDEFLNEVNKAYVLENLDNTEVAKEEFFNFCMDSNNKNVKEFKSLADLVLNLKVGEYGMVTYQN